jgi:hypothetical protein
MIVVIPSCRSVNLDYLRPLINSGARFIVVDDTPGSVRVDHPQFQVFNWGDQRRLLGDFERAIPRRNGACRDLGFYIAWREASADEIVIALDDDCVVEEPDFAAQAKDRLDHGANASVSGSGHSFNVLDLYEGVDGTRVFPRGFPYSDRAAYRPWSIDGRIEGRVLFNVGLWKGVFDVNAIDKIRLDRYSFPDASLRVPSVLVPEGALISVCSMNMHFRVEVIPAVYQLPMHVEVVPNWVIDRYGDIWGGFILKTLMDVRGDRLNVGGPMIRHLKEGDYTRNIWQEHLCHLVNDEFIDLLGRTKEVLRPSSYVDMMAHLREEFAKNAAACSPILSAYLKHLDGPLRAWVAALRQLRP